MISNSLPKKKRESLNIPKGAIAMAHTYVVCVHDL